MEFASEYFEITKVIKKGLTITFPFGPPTSGIIHVKLERVFEVPNNSKIVTIPNLKNDTFSNFVVLPPSKKSKSSRSGPTNPIGGPIGPIGGPIDPIGGIDNPLDPNLPPLDPPGGTRKGDPNKVKYQLRLANKVKFEGKGVFNKFNYQEQSTTTAIPTVLSGTHSWNMRVTNEAKKDYSVKFRLFFKGNRKILQKEINFDLLQKKINELIATPESFFRITLENKKDLEIPDPNNRNRTIKVFQTHFALKSSEAFEILYGKIGSALGKKIMTNKKIESTQIQAKATSYNGKFAIRVDVNFHQNSNNLIKITDDAFLGIFDAIVDVSLKIHRLYLSVFIILDQGDFDKISFKATINESSSYFDKRNKLEVVNKNILEGDGFNTVIKGTMEKAIELKLEELALKYAQENEITIGRILQTWFLGDAKLELIGYDQKLWMKYPGKKPKLPVIAPNIDRPTQPSLKPGNLSKIDHIVVLMMENRSFDHLLGYLSLPTSKHGNGRSDVDGLTGSESNLGTRNFFIRPKRHRVFPIRTANLPKDFKTPTAFPWDPGHGLKDTTTQRGKKNANGKYRMDGYIKDFSARLKGKYKKNLAQRLKYEKFAMGYYDKRDLFCYDELATNYGICDRWFAAHPGSTWPNRFITVTGQLAPGKDGKPETGNPSITGFDPLEIPTIFDHLTDRDISWSFFEHDFCFLRLFSKYTLDDKKIFPFNDPIKGFEKVAKAGNLPAVTFIEPDLTDIPGSNDDHPPSDILDGQALVANIYNTLKNSPKWNKTLFIVTYDEHGGFYDHFQLEDNVAEPLFFDSKNDPVTHYGMRVPTFIVSPWVKKGTVSKKIYDHTSIIKTIMARFMPDKPPYMGPRVKAANDVGSMLSKRLIGISTPDIKPPIKIGSRSVLASKPAPETFGLHNDFHFFMGKMKEQIKGK